MTKKRSTPKKAHIAVTPYLTVRSAASAIAFYKAAFGAEEVTRSNVAGTDIIQHAELKVCGASIYLCDEFPDTGILSPLAFGGSATMLHLDVEDAAKTWDAALQAGALEVAALADVPWGGICGKLVDPFGHYWSIASAGAIENKDVFAEVAPIELGVQSETSLVAAN